MKIAIMGATGVVGREMLNALKEENIDVSKLKLLASKRSTGQKISFKDEILTVEELKEDSFKGYDIVLGATSNDLAKRYVSEIKKAGAIFIDNSSLLHYYLLHYSLK